ncbi:MAG: DUF3302 domain-containing protein [Gammaproteobacteria bacterium]|nr:DUF3302 domain-containing protein [Gammaproteobacteria bacterium]
MSGYPERERIRRLLSASRPALVSWLLLSGQSAHAAFLSGEAMDKAADIIALFVLIVVPTGLIVLFWLVHVLPEKVAEARHHPQKDMIKVLCILSLFFGGLLWPIAWLMAYSKPVLYKLAYGRDRHDDYYRDLASQDAPDGELPAEDVTQLRQELDKLAAKGRLPEELHEMRARLMAVEARVARPPVSEGTD